MNSPEPSLRKESSFLNSSWLCYLLALLPLLQLILNLVRYKLDVPFWDQWELVPLLEKSYEGTLRFQDLWIQHNEHRIFFPKLILLFLARLTHWSLSWELAVNVLLGAAIFGVLAVKIRELARETGNDFVLWSLPAVSLLVFSMKQWTNWIWGWQMQIFLCVFAATAGIFVLSGASLVWLRFATAVLLGVVASYSFGSGLCYWPAGLLVLLLGDAGDRKAKRIRAGLWAASCAVVVFFYLYRFPKMSVDASLTFVAEHPGIYLNYFFSYLGLPLVEVFRWQSFAIGIAGFIFLVYLVRLTAAYRVKYFNQLVPFLALCVFSSCSALLTGLGRADKSDYALGYHYVTVAMMFWVSFIVFVHVLVMAPGPKILLSNPFYKHGVKLVFCFYGLVVFLMVYSSIEGGWDCRERYAYYLPAQKELAGKMVNDKLLEGLYPSAATIRQRAAVLKKYRLTIFR